MNDQTDSARLRHAVRHIQQMRDTGALAELRRGWTEAQPGFAFWKLSDVFHLDLRPQWAPVLALLAQAKGTYDPSTGFGRAMARAGVLEARAHQLLQANAATITPRLRAVANLVTSRGVPFDHVQAALLLLYPEGGTAAETLRRRIAMDYTASLPKAP